MKKYNIRHVAFIVLVSASIFSYSYLSCVPVKPVSTKSSDAKTEKIIEIPNFFTPDIALTKKIIRLVEVIR